MSKILNKKAEEFRVVVDEPRIFLEASLGYVMVRGEVIANFSNEIYIQGPIELSFEGIQRFFPWPGIMKNSAFGTPIETKLQVVELTLLPPNTNGSMPPGIQRFPFEFPLPTTLPTSVQIKDRLEITYSLSATIRRISNPNKNGCDNNNLIGWIERARLSAIKKKYVAFCPLRVVRAMESIVEDGLNVNSLQNPQQHTNMIDIENSENNESESSSNQINLVASTNRLPWISRNLNEYQTTMDERHELLAFSLAGRSSGNLNRPIQDLNSVEGVRYKIGIDRTAIALGTSIGVEVMIEPTSSDCVIKSITLSVRESRKYSMKVPAGYSRGFNLPETKESDEGVNMVLKWAFGYQMDGNEEESLVYPNSRSTKCSLSAKGERYVRQKIENSQYLAYFDPPQPGHPNSKSFLSATIESTQKEVPKHISQNKEIREHEENSHSIGGEEQDVLNLKMLNQIVHTGEYFGGRFVMPVPDCSSALNPSMDYESIKISHWLQLVVRIECNGRVFDLFLDTPGRILDCRLVHDDDDKSEIILPPPPIYQPGDEKRYQNTWTPSTFWEQREPITLASSWGSCAPCPCKVKKANQSRKSMEKKKSSTGGKHESSSTSHIESSSNSRSDRSSSLYPSELCSPSHLPEWGPPPCYSEN